MKFDVSTIEGFEAMSAEEKLAALLNAELPEQDYTGYIKKTDFDRVASQLADYKRQLREKQGTEEAEAAARAEREAELQQKYDELLRKSTIAEHTARYVGMEGYTEELAKEAAEALADGDMNKVFEVQQRAIANYATEMRAQRVKDDPHPGGQGGGDDTPTDVAFGAKLGKSRAASDTAAQDVLNHYITGSGN